VNDAAASATRKLLDVDDETQMHQRSLVPDAYVSRHVGDGYVNVTHADDHGDVENVGPKRTGRSLLQLGSTYEALFCDRMRLNLFYKSRSGNLLTPASLLDMRAADKLLTSHPKYDKLCAKWTTPSGATVRIGPFPNTNTVCPYKTDISFLNSGVHPPTLARVVFLPRVLRRFARVQRPRRPIFCYFLRPHGRERGE
jgi:hypothetical protein